jgi:hypothetical protein
MHRFMANTENQNVVEHADALGELPPVTHNGSVVLTRGFDHDLPDLPD